MLKIYGSMLCKDCVACLKDLDNAGVAYEYRDFSENLVWLKEFLVMRDGNSVFENARKEGMIGIPCIVTEDGRVTLDWQEFLDM